MRSSLISYPTEQFSKQPRPQGSLMSLTGNIGTPGQAQRHSGFEWLCKHNRLRLEPIQSRSQRPRGLAMGIATSGQVQLRKSTIHGLPVTLLMLRVKSDKPDWFWSQSIVFTQPLKTGMSLGLARGPDISSA